MINLLRARKFLYAWIVGLLCLAACDALPAWELVPVPTPAPSGSILFEDDFSKVPNGWGISESADAAVAYERNGLRILIGQSGKDAWSVAGKKYGDVSIGVIAQRLSGPEDNMIGLICRYRDRGNFYLGFVSSDRYYGIAKVVDNAFTMISNEELQYSSSLPDADAKIQLNFLCSRDLLALIANGQSLAQVRDNDFKDGDVGVFAGAYDQPGVDILFDDFSVRQP